MFSLRHWGGFRNQRYQGFSSSSVSTVVKSSMHCCRSTLACWWGISMLLSFMYFCRCDMTQWQRHAQAAIMHTTAEQASAPHIPQPRSHCSASSSCQGPSRWRRRAELQTDSRAFAETWSHAQGRILRKTTHAENFNKTTKGHKISFAELSQVSRWP